MLILTDSQKVTLAIAPVSKAGNPAVVESSAWSSSDDTVLTVVAADDGMSAVATVTGVLGSAQVSVSADADMGEGVETLIGTLDVDVVAGQAVSLGISVGAPEEI